MTFPRMLHLHAVLMRSAAEKTATKLVRFASGYSRGSPDLATIGPFQADLLPNRRQTSFALPQRRALIRASACPTWTPSSPVRSPSTVSSIGAASPTVSPTSVVKALRFEADPEHVHLELHSIRKGFRGACDEARARNRLDLSVVDVAARKSTCFSPRSDRTSSASASMLTSGSFTTRACLGVERAPHVLKIGIVDRSDRHHCGRRDDPQRDGGAAVGRAVDRR